MASDIIVDIIIDIIIDDVMFDMVTSSSSCPSVKLHVVDVFIDITQTGYERNSFMFHISYSTLHPQLHSQEVHQ